MFKNRNKKLKLSTMHTHSQLKTKETCYTPLALLSLCIPPLSCLQCEVILETTAVISTHKHKIHALRNIRMVDERIWLPNQKIPPDFFLLLLF